MDMVIAPAVRAECLKHDIRLAPAVQAGVDTGKPIAVEAPASLHRGKYDVDLIGAYTYIGGGNTTLRHVGLIGRFCAIARNLQAGDFEHPTNFLSAHPLFQASPGWRPFAADFIARNSAMIEKSQRLANALYENRFGKIQIGNDVWIGEGVFIRRGVEIGDGAIIGARSVVTRDVPPYAIVAGSPAKIVRYRFESDVIDELLRLQWWLYGLSALDGVDFTDIDLALWRIDQNISSGRAAPYQAPIINIARDTAEKLCFAAESEKMAYSL